MKPIAKRMSFFIIIFFEYFGAMLFAYLNFQNVALYHKAQTTTGSLTLWTNYFFALFIVACYGRQFSGGIYNNCIVFYRIIRRTDRLSFKIGLLYLGVQIAGALSGSLIFIYVSDGDYSPYDTLLPGHQQFIRFIGEVFGAFILAFMIQFAADKRFTFIQHNREAYICLPLIFMIAKGYVKDALLNPAHGFAFQCAYAIKFRTWDPILMAYIPFFGPFCGAFLACLAFQFILKPLYPYKKQHIQALLEKILKQNQKKLRVSKIKQSEIQAYRQNYRQQALKMGIQIDSQDEQKQSLMQSQSQNNADPNNRNQYQLQNQTIYQTQSISSKNRSLKRQKRKRRNSKLNNRRWTLGEILKSQPMKAPLKKFQQKFFKLTNIANYKQQKPQIQCMNDDIQSIQEDSQQQAPLIITKRPSKLSALNPRRISQQSDGYNYKPSLIIKQEQVASYKRYIYNKKQQIKIQDEIQNRGGLQMIARFQPRKSKQFVTRQLQLSIQKSISLKQSEFKPRVYDDDEDDGSQYRKEEKRQQIKQKQDERKDKQSRNNDSNNWKG